jgi:hypothetical protein
MPRRGSSTKVALSVAYGASLRAAEVVSPKVCDIDGKRMIIRVEQGMPLVGVSPRGRRAVSRAAHRNSHRTAATLVRAARAGTIS